MTRLDANKEWNKVTAEFVRRVSSGENEELVIKDLQTRYEGIGPVNQQRLRDLKPAPAPGPGPKPSKNRIFAPYTESWLFWSGWNGAKKLTDIPTKNLTLAFVLDGGHGVPKFDGSMDANIYVPQANEVQKKGGVIRISFGGATGTDLAIGITSVDKLVEAYDSVIKMYNTRYIDLDIEGAATANTSSVKRRNKAMSMLQKKYPDLKIDYTLATMQTGLQNDGISILKDAKAQGVKVNAVNLMAMDYGTGEKQMGKAAISAANAAKKQCDKIGLDYNGIGITPMILVNDTAPETFTVENAKEVVEFSNKTSWVVFLGFWSTGRDTKQWDFMKEFNKYK